ncbi:MAG: tRNA 2-thiouridine(34) synthase MnmA, partial [candidate division WOR-3 bacterium]
CCGIQAVRDAARVAARLGFPYYPVDFRQDFERDIIEDFCSEYGRGRTPNPCIRCNEKLKFRVMLGRLQELGAESLATGHHARITRDNCSWQLRKGVDERKDQSYFLYTMTQDQMARVLMPVGEHTKTDVRRLARRLGLAVAEKAESQEICFIPDNDYTGFLRRRRPDMFRPGPVLDTSGREIGRHQGICGYTVGQRRGFGIALGERRYVTSIDAERNAVVLGTENDARSTRGLVQDVNWVSGNPPEHPLDAVVKIRYQHSGARAQVEPLKNRCARVSFAEPQWAITPGQAMVFYSGDVVLGGGTIARSGE